MATPEIPHIVRVESNLKAVDGQPWAVDLSLHNFLLGPVRAGKSSVMEAIELACTHAVSRSGKSKPVQSAGELAKLGPRGDCTVFSVVTWSNGMQSSWSIDKTEEWEGDEETGYRRVSISTSNLQKSAPRGFAEETFAWAPSMRGAMQTASPKARTVLLEKLGAVFLGSADLDAILSRDGYGDLQAVYVETRKREAEAGAKPRPPLKVLEDISAQAASKKRATTAAVAAVAGIVAEAPLPSEIESAKAEVEAARAARTAAETTLNQTLAQHAPYVGPMDAATAALQGAPGGALKGPEEIAALQAQYTSAVQRVNGMQQAPQPLPPDHPLRAIHAMLTRVDAATFDGHCPVCGGTAALAALQERAAAVGTFLAGVDAQSAASGEARAVMQRVGRACLSAYAASVLVPLQTHERAAAQALQTLEMRAAQAGVLQGGGSGLSAPGLPAAPALPSTDWTAVAAQCARATNRLLKAAVDKLTTKAQGYLPDDMVPVCELDGQDNLVWGVRDASGYPNEWVSGFEEAIILAAFCMAAVPDGYPAVYLMPDVSSDPASTREALIRLMRAPIQLVWTSTTKPAGKTPAGCNLVKMEPRKARVRKGGKAPVVEADGEDGGSEEDAGGEA